MPPHGKDYSTKVTNIVLVTIVDVAERPDSDMATLGGSGPPSLFNSQSLHTSLRASFDKNVTVRVEEDAILRQSVESLKDKLDESVKGLEKTLKGKPNVYTEQDKQNYYKSFEGGFYDLLGDIALPH